MNVNECITTRRSIRKYKPDPVDHSLIESIVSMASYSPSWKNTQITRYIAIDDSSILKKIADDCTPVYNSNIILLLKEGAVLNVTVLILQKKKTVGRCSIQELPVRLSALLQKRKGLALSLWAFLMKTRLQSF